MNLHNYKRASDYSVQTWIEKELELTSYQKQKLRDGEIVRFAPYTFMERRKKISNPWLRLTIILFPFAWLFLFIGLPFVFLFTGSWGYKHEHIKWFDKWISSLGL